MESPPLLCRHNQRASQSSVCSCDDLRVPPPSEAGERTLLSAILAQVVRFTAPLGSSEEEKKVQDANFPTKVVCIDNNAQRVEEFITKYTASIQKHLGERVKEMYVVASLATDPEKQGHGYASTLVRVVTDRVSVLPFALLFLLDKHARLS